MTIEKAAARLRIAEARLNRQPLTLMHIHPMYIVLCLRRATRARLILLDLMTQEFKLPRVDVAAVMMQGVRHARQH